MVELPANVLKILSVLESDGHEAFIVGGCVRDLIRGTAPKDWDIASSALPSRVKVLFSRTFDSGIKHGTITVLIEKEHYEVTTYRVDGEYLDGRRPSQVTFAGKIEEDLSRRDFTVNAIAYNPARGFIDPFGGRGDIEKGIIKCVGLAENRFNEDALRMLRAIRFAAVLDFSLDGEALRAIDKLKNKLENISAERIRGELTQLLCGANPGALSILESTGLMYYVLRNREYGGDLNAVISQLKKCPMDEQMRLALFFSWAGEKCGEIMRDLRFDNKTIKAIILYTGFLFDEILRDRYEIKKLLRNFSYENFQKLLILKACVSGDDFSFFHEEARDIIEQNECFTLRGLAVNGDDLLNAGIPKDKQMGDKLEKLLDIVMRNPEMNVREKLLCL